MKSLLIILSFLLSSFCLADPGPVQSLVRVNMTSQSYYFYQPWEKQDPSTRRGLGAVIAGDKVLTGAKYLANSTYIEIEHPVTGKKLPAKIEAIDYEANLALLSPLEPMFPDREPLELDTDASAGDTLEAWQVESNGTPLIIESKISRTQVGTTFLDDHEFLQYEVSGVMQFRGGSVTVPMIRDGKLAGLLVSYDSKEQVSEVIAGPIIEHFLTDIADGEYEGFPSLGISVSQTLDDQFRKYLQLPENGGGIYVSEVKPGGTADQSGLKKGDVILSIDGNPIDARGYYTHPEFGKLEYLHLIRSKPFVGDNLKLGILRSGENSDLIVTLDKQPASAELIDPYMFDRAPRYIVLGGLVFQELTRTYLEMYGSDWKNRAPFKLSYADAYPSKYEKEGLDKLVFLSRVIPTKNNVGYEKLSHLIVKKVNGTKITDIKDLDKALAEPLEGFHKIEFTEFPSVIYIDAEEAGKTNVQLKKDYGIHELKQIE
ncbi:MAG: PDZ domain-containing protein [Verrucomicrobiales bacterium]|nr:PDZ domain-containing protein [Verrucomicrobiales bacterium]